MLIWIRWSVVPYPGCVIRGASNCESSCTTWAVWMSCNIISDGCLHTLYCPQICRYFAGNHNQTWGWNGNRCLSQRCTLGMDQEATKWSQVSIRMVLPSKKQSALCGGRVMSNHSKAVWWASQNEQCQPSWKTALFVIRLGHLLKTDRNGSQG